MEKKNPKRKSHCEICGKRLSYKTTRGEIQWQSSHIDDEGIYCVSCYMNKDFGKNSKRSD